MIVASFMLALLPVVASAHTEGDPSCTALIAGQHLNAGEVCVWNDADNLYVQYMTTGGWELVETHLHVATSLSGIPQTGKGNPIPGHFEHDPGIAGDPYPIPRTWCAPTTLYIAAHAEVQQVLELAPYYACLVVESNQGLRKDGTPVRTQRSTPEQGLEFETGEDESNFFSLGFGGSIIVEFCCPIRNGDGNDVKVIEDTWGSYPLERAQISASQDGSSWTDLGEADNTNAVGIHTISEFDLGALAWAKYIKIEDTTDPAVHASDADGFDLNAVEALQDCIQEETAWGEGPGFPGKNWAMYFTYEVQEVLVDTVVVDAGDMDGADSNIVLESGGCEYRFEATGTWQDKSQPDHYIDAEYTTFDGWATHMDGTTNWGPDQKDLQVDEAFVDWGLYDGVGHTYSLVFPGTGFTVNFRVFDGKADQGSGPEPGWYPDNDGTITVNIYR